MNGPGRQLALVGALCLALLGLWRTWLNLAELWAGGSVAFAAAGTITWAVAGVAIGLWLRGRRLTRSARQPPPEDDGGAPRSQYP